MSNIPPDFRTPAGWRARHRAARFKVVVVGEIRRQRVAQQDLFRRELEVHDEILLLVAEPPAKRIGSCKCVRHWALVALLTNVKYTAILQDASRLASASPRGAFQSRSGRRDTPTACRATGFVPSRTRSP